MGLKDTCDNCKPQFKASNGRVEKFYCELGFSVYISCMERVELSYQLELESVWKRRPEDHMQYQQIRLLYRMGPSNSYHLAHENRSEIKVTECSMHNHRFSMISMSTRKLAIHLLILSLENPPNPLCLRGTEFSHLKWIIGLNRIFVLILSDSFIGSRNGMKQSKVIRQGLGA